MKAIILALGLMMAPSLWCTPALEVVARFTDAAKLVRTDSGQTLSPPMVIRDQTEFLAFQTLAPSHQLSTMRIDWSRFMLLVVFDTRPAMFAPNILWVSQDGDHVVAHVRYPKPTSLVESTSVGCFSAALVARSTLRVEWEGLGHEVDPDRNMMLTAP